MFCGSLREPDVATAAVVVLLFWQCSADIFVVQRGAWVHTACSHTFIVVIARYTEWAAWGAGTSLMDLVVASPVLLHPSDKTKMNTIKISPRSLSSQFSVTSYYVKISH